MTGENEKRVFQPKKFRQLSDDPWVEVLRFSKTTREMELYSFRTSRVDTIESRGPRQSTISLINGTAIALSLPYAELVEKIDEGSSPVDLKEYCETVVPDPDLGQLIDNEGIYIGKYAPRDREGRSLEKIFNVFAAREDLTGTMKYADVVKCIAGLNNLNGHDGTNYATDKELYQALRDGSYNGGWIIPTCDILRGHAVDGKETMPDNLYAHKDKGALKGTFSGALDNSDWYCSSTERRDNSTAVYVVRFSDGGISGASKSSSGTSWVGRDDYWLNCRPVRLVEVRRP